MNRPTVTFFLLCILLFSFTVSADVTMSDFIGTWIRDEPCPHPHPDLPEAFTIQRVIYHTPLFSYPLTRLDFDLGNIHIHQIVWFDRLDGGDLLKYEFPAISSCEGIKFILYFAYDSDDSRIRLYLYIYARGREWHISAEEQCEKCNYYRKQ